VLPTVFDLLECDNLVCARGQRRLHNATAGEQDVVDSPMAFVQGIAPPQLPHLLLNSACKMVVHKAVVLLASL